MSIRWISIIGRSIRETVDGGVRVLIVIHRGPRSSWKDVLESLAAAG